jgi:NAD(P)-dependent dehydrogenase (short-subunit alcohol dehydrogenase family)
LSNSVEKIETTHILTGKTALITGGSRGIGAAISKTLAKRGANVVVNYFNNETSANSVVSEINDYRNGNQLVGNAMAIQANVTNT